MKTIKTAWVRIVEESSKYQEMSFDDVKTLCKERNLCISKNKMIFDVDEYTFTPECNAIREYSFVVGHYQTPPHIDLVPKGTIIEYGLYIFPQK